MRVKRIEQSIIRQQVSPRGGGIEIDLKKWGYPNGKMTAYQNYLGGGMLEELPVIAMFQTGKA